MKEESSLISFFEFCIWKSRLFVILAVVASILAGMLMIILGSVSVFWDLSHFTSIFSSSTGLEMAHRALIIQAVSAMDTFLIATVLFIFGIGLYDLFVRKMHVLNIDENSELTVTSLEQLKEKLIKVILIVLVVTFFKYAISFSYKTVQDLLYLSIGVLLISLSMFISHIKKK